MNIGIITLTQGDGGFWFADLNAIPGTPSLGIGETKELAIIDLFLKAIKSGSIVHINVDSIKIEEKLNKDLDNISIDIPKNIVNKMLNNYVLGLLENNIE